MKKKILFLFMLLATVSVNGDTLTLRLSETITMARERS